LSDILVKYEGTPQQVEEKIKELAALQEEMSKYDLGPEAPEATEAEIERLKDLHNQPVPTSIDEPMQETLFENWRKYQSSIILEKAKEEEFHKAKDSDQPLPRTFGGGANITDSTGTGIRVSKHVLVFEPSDQYLETEDLIHGGMSHAIKHLWEIDASAVEKSVNEALKIVKTEIPLENIFIHRTASTTGKKKNKKILPATIIAEGEEALSLLEKHPWILLNTFDFIQDKYWLSNQNLSNPYEMQLLPIIEEMSKKYFELIDLHLEGDWIKISDQSVDELIDILNNRSKIIAPAAFGTNQLEQDYHFDLDRGLFTTSDNEGKIKTFYKPEKREEFPSLGRSFCDLHSIVLKPLKYCRESGRGSMRLLNQNLIQAFEKVTNFKIVDKKDVQQPLIKSPETSEQYISIFDPMWLDMETKELAAYIASHLKEIQEEMHAYLLPLLKNMVRAIVLALPIPADARAAFMTIVEANIEKISRMIVRHISDRRNIELLLRLLRAAKEDSEEMIEDYIFFVIAKLTSQPNSPLMNFLKSKVMKNIAQPTPEEDARRARELSQQFNKQSDEINENMKKHNKSVRKIKILIG